MKRNVSIWAALGFLVAAGWAVLPLLMGPATFDPSGALWTVARVTCPVAYASTLLHVPVRFYWAMLANAATYALIGLMIEVLRSQFRHAHA